jgi:hypothetical protein
MFRAIVIERRVRFQAAGLQVQFALLDGVVDAASVVEQHPRIDAKTVEIDRVVVEGVGGGVDGAAQLRPAGNAAVDAWVSGVFLAFEVDFRALYAQIGLFHDKAVFPGVFHASLERPGVLSLQGKCDRDRGREKKKMD